MAKKKTSPGSSPLTDLSEGRGAFTPIPGESRSAHFKEAALGKAGTPGKGTIPSTVVGTEPFETHVRNTMEAVTGATHPASPPDGSSQVERGNVWYPNAGADAWDLAVSNNKNSVMYTDTRPGGMQGISRARRVPGDRFFVSPYEQEKAAAEISGTSPARPAGMEWESKKGVKMNVPAAHQLKTITPEQRGDIDTAVAADRVQRAAGGVRTTARNADKNDAIYQAGGTPKSKAWSLGPRTEAVTNAESNYDAAQADTKAKSKKARAPFKGTPLGHAGIQAIEKGHDIHSDKYDKPLEALGNTKERSFAHDMLRPLDAEIVFNGESGTIDEHQRNVMEGKGVHHVWTEGTVDNHGGSNKGKPARTAPNPGKKPGYEYGRTVLHEAARRMNPSGEVRAPAEPTMRPNAAQPISWISEKETKPNSR